MKSRPGNSALALACLALGIVAGISLWRRDARQDERCVRQLLMLRMAAALYADDLKIAPGTAIRLADLHNYLEKGAPACPRGGAYNITVAVPPTCTATNHVLPATP